MDFTQLYTDHYDHVLRTARNYLRNHGEAEDAAQDTFLEAYESMDSYDESYAVATWLNRICVNKCRDKLRRRKLENKSFVAMTDNNEHLLDIQEDLDSPERVMEAEENANKVLQLFLSMPDNISNALTLRLIDGLSYKQVAEKMGSPEGSVKTWVRRGRTQILQAISPQ